MNTKKSDLTKSEQELIAQYQEKWRVAWAYGAGAIIGTLILAIFTEFLILKLQTDYETVMTSLPWSIVAWVAVGLSVADVVCAVLAVCYKLKADKILRRLRDSALADLHNKSRS